MIIYLCPHLVPISAAEGPLLVPISLKIRSSFGPHFDKFRSPFHVGAVPSLRNMKKCLLRTERAYFACFLKLWSFFQLPATKGFHHHGQKSDALPLARFFSSPHFPLEGVVEGMSSSGGCTHHSGCLAGVDHSHVQRRILASHPVWKQHTSQALLLLLLVHLGPELPLGHSHQLLLSCLLQGWMSKLSGALEGGLWRHPGQHLKEASTKGLAC